jgi:glyoxylase-like metal-dependent hydrolase (beta-lactamase superfamily II)
MSSPERPPHEPSAGSLEQVGDGVWSLVLPFHSHYPGATLTYLIDGGDGTLCVVDPAWAASENRELLASGLRRIGRSVTDVALVVVTHLHPDHIGLADDLRRASGAPVALHRADQEALEQGLPLTDVDGDWFARWGVPVERRGELVRWWVEERRYPVVHADVLLDGGEDLPFAGRALSVLHTPGHTSGSICLVDEAAEAVFTGDHLLPDVYPGIGLGGGSRRNPIQDYLDSLTLLVPYDEFEALPGHGRPFRPLGTRRAKVAAHHRRRTDEVGAALDRMTTPTVWDVAAELRWSGGWSAMADYRLASALSQTAQHVDLLGRWSELAAPATAGGEAPAQG